MESNVTKILTKKLWKRCVTLPWIAHIRYGPPLLVLTFTDNPPRWGPRPPPPQKKRTFPKVKTRFRFSQTGCSQNEMYVLFFVVIAESWVKSCLWMTQWLRIKVACITGVIESSELFFSEPREERDSSEQSNNKIWRLQELLTVGNKFRWKGPTNLTRLSVNWQNCRRAIKKRQGIGLVRQDAAWCKMFQSVWVKGFFQSL